MEEFEKMKKHEAFHWVFFLLFIFFAINIIFTLIDYNEQYGSNIYFTLSCLALFAFPLYFAFYQLRHIIRHRHKY